MSSDGITDTLRAWPCGRCGHAWADHMPYVGCRVDGCPCVPLIDSRLVRCDDPECSVAWAYRDPPTEHWHPRPHGPDLPWVEVTEPVCVICGVPGRILCEVHR